MQFDAELKSIDQAIGIVNGCAHGLYASGVPVQLPECKFLIRVVERLHERFWDIREGIEAAKKELRESIPPARTDG